MFHRLPLLAAIALTSLQLASNGFSAEITAERSEKGAIVKIDGKFFTEYLIRSGNKPILWPILGPTDKPMTRDYPMLKHAGEPTDHLHHRSMWCAHGNVNGISFWLEKPTKGVKKLGTIKHVEFTKIAGGTTATIATKNDWIGPDGRRVCSDERLLQFGAADDARWIDFDITLKATDGDVVFGDSKEGFFCVRVAEGLRVDAKRGGKIVNSNGQVNADAWGKPASWIDDYGPIDGQTVGIAIFNHPSSLRYPTGWHARTYGVIGPNPFAEREFTGDRKKDGSLKIADGQTAQFRYCVLFHRGDEREGKVAERFAAYAKEKK